MKINYSDDEQRRASEKRWDVIKQVWSSYFTIDPEDDLLIPATQFEIKGRTEKQIEGIIKRFETGTFEDRKAILRRLGSNLILKDKVLHIDLENTLIPMQTVSREAQAVHAGFEPRETPINREEIEHLYTQSPRLLRG
ncbi:hypothetical protein IID24_04675 [Patescibacteria group bacterium]|nr:hypothetical protein [Patescibacteria group bacterium]